MPRVKPTASEERRKNLSARIQYHMAKLGYDNEKMASILGISERTFCSKKLHAPDTFSIAEMWQMEKVFGCSISEPIKLMEA